MGIVESFMAGALICTLLVAGYIGFASTAEDDNSAFTDAGQSSAK
jgi:hypothetical protein